MVLAYDVDKSSGEGQQGNRGAVLNFPFVHLDKIL